MAPAKTFVLYPSLVFGHLNPMAKLSTHLLCRGHNVAVAIADPPDSDAVSADAVARLAAANSSIAFLLSLPAPGPRSIPAQSQPRQLRVANPVLRDFLLSLPAPGADAALLEMFFCVDALDIAAELTYFFFSSVARDLAVFLDLPYSYPNLQSFRDMGETLVRFPGMTSVRAVDMPLTIQGMERDPTKVRIMYQFRRIPEWSGGSC